VLLYSYSDPAETQRQTPPGELIEIILVKPIAALMHRDVFQVEVLGQAGHVMEQILDADDLAVVGKLRRYGRTLSEMESFPWSCRISTAVAVKLFRDRGEVEARLWSNRRAESEVGDAVPLHEEKPSGLSHQQGDTRSIGPHSFFATRSSTAATSRASAAAAGLRRFQEPDRRRRGTGEKLAGHGCHLTWPRESPEFMVSAADTEKQSRPIDNVGLAVVLPHALQRA